MSTPSAEEPLTFQAKLVKVPVFWVKRAMFRSAKFRSWIERRNHMRIAEQAWLTRTPPAFLVLDAEPAPPIWAQPVGLPGPPVQGCDPRSFTASDANVARSWIADPAHIQDGVLAARLDGWSDQVGRVTEALECRLALLEDPPRGNQPAFGARILIDARCLQQPHLATRGIGRYAEALVRSAIEAALPNAIDLFIDPRQIDVPHDLAIGADVISRIENPQQYGVLIQPSPMTASPFPILDVLMGDIARIAIVHDVIPLHYPKHYLPDLAAQAEYAACLDALGHYDILLCNSHTTAAEITELLDDIDHRHGRTRQRKTHVIWPSFIETMRAGSPLTPSNRDAPIVVVAGDEPRKNLIGALGAIGLATTGQDRPPIIVVGMADHAVAVHHAAIASGLRPGEATAISRVSDKELAALLASASLVVVPSIDEGLSLPVIEAAEARTPVVASDIAPHRELIGPGDYLVDPRNVRAMATAINRFRGDRALAERQRANVQRHQHEILETWVHDTITALPQQASSPPPLPRASTARTRIAIATPWPPQHSGVADFSAATIPAIAQLCDLTIVTTQPIKDLPRDAQWLPLDNLVANAGEFDDIVLVLGNSSLHLPFFNLLDRLPATVLTHDTRFVEFYAALRGGGVEPLMLRTKDDEAPTTITPLLQQQLADIRLMQNHAMWEVARQAKRVLWHTPTAGERIAKQTGVHPIALPFANYRTPDPAELTVEFRNIARHRLGFDLHPDGTIHLASFGFVDTRTKMADVVLESAIWLTDWGHRVSLTFVGEAEPHVQAQLEQRAAEAGIYDFRITGYTDEAEYRNYLAAIDLGIQLRISPYLGVAGALSDMAARGVVALGSRGVCQDVGTPPFIDRLPDAVSAISVASAIETRIHSMPDPQVVERMRLAYLEETSPERYAQAFLDALTETSAAEQWRTPHG